ncbi:NAD+ synthase [Pseudoroseicyclus sp. CXY001]|uniref:NAD+ synthase n=1 Tax=Pseudoroseicyclus sp. CXY001 TaxID=3242492 RepID=UPI00358DC009
MADRFRLTLAQWNPVMGDIAGNAAKAREAWEAGRAAGSDFVVLPEMFLSGYQPQDLVMKPAFTHAAMAAVEALAKDCADGPMLGIGAPFLDEKGLLFNSYAVLKHGRIHARRLKTELPNYNVFDEKRVFAPGPLSGPFDAGPLRIGIPICEDSWFPDVAEAMAESGADLLVVPNGSPYRRGKFHVRMHHMVARVVETGLPLVYLNQVAGQDDQVFDGGSFVLNRKGALAVQWPVFDEKLDHVDFAPGPDGWAAVEGEKATHPGDLEQDYRAMVLSVGDYMRKCGFKAALLGLSGGVDSALTAAVAADALGPENLRAVMLPSEYTSEHSLEDAKLAAERLGCRYDFVPIGPGRQAITETLAPLFEGLAPDVTEENIQSRLRGLLLMALSNKFGEMLLTTGNKSELAVGYATIYGDMNGGYNPLKDVYKTRVFELCRWRNANHRSWMKGPEGEVIPARIIDKPPSAELRADQKDSDSLPPYEVLDGILDLLVDHEASLADCVEAGFDREVVKRIEHLLYISEYKRFQSAPGTRLTNRAFWLDRRYPIVNRWRDGS